MEELRTQSNLSSVLPTALTQRMQKIERKKYDQEWHLNRTKSL